MQSIEEKKALVELGLTKLLTLQDKKEYFQKNGNQEKVKELSLEIEKIESEIDYCDIDRVNARKLLNSMYMKNKRLRQRIELMKQFSNCIYFATFTLNNDFIDFRKETLEIYLKRALKENCNVYVANADYGSLNERLHFHAIITCRDIEKLRDAWKYGFSDFEKVKWFEHSPIKMAKYITKLTNHAMKDSTRPLENKLIYSRDVQKGCINELFD